MYDYDIYLVCTLPMCYPRRELIAYVHQTYRNTAIPLGPRPPIIAGAAEKAGERRGKRRRRRRAYSKLSEPGSRCGRKAAAGQSAPLGLRP